MIGKNVQSYCCEDISKIYGYKEAIADNENYWDCHHCLGLVWSREQLIEMGLYYNQPAERLMFVTKNEHFKLHATFNENIQKSFCKKGVAPWNKGKTDIYSEETRKKMSIAKKGKRLTEETRKKISEGNKGKHLTKETRKKLSEATKGKKMSDEARKKQSEARKKYYESEEARKKQSEIQKKRFENPEERNKRAKKVYQYTLDGEFVKEWVSLSEVSRQLGLSIQGLSSCCLGHIKTYKGHIWSYEPLH